MAFRQVVLQEVLGLSGDTATDVVRMPYPAWFDTLGIGPGLQVVVQLITCKSASLQFYTTPRLDGPDYLLDALTAPDMSAVGAFVSPGASRSTAGAPAMPFHRFLFWQVAATGANWEVVFRITLGIEMPDERDVPASRSSLGLEAEDAPWVRISSVDAITSVIEDSGAWRRTEGVSRLELDLEVTRLLNAKVEIETANGVEGPWVLALDVATVGLASLILTRDAGVSSANTLRRLVRWRAVQVSPSMAWEACFRMTHVA